MKITILGCGTSGGVPLLGCDCPVCRSPDPRNRRRRASVVVEHEATRILVDTSPDLRTQCMDAGILAVDAVLYTHDHADHSHGIDDLRGLNRAMDQAIHVYGDAPTLASLGRRFGYAFEPVNRSIGWYKPELIPHEITGPFRIGNIDVVPFSQKHGRRTTLGFRFGPVAYSTDVNALDDAAFAVLAGVDVWVVDCLQYRENFVHSHLAQTLDWIRRVRPRRAVLTHMGHAFDYATLARELPPGVEPGRDGLVIEARHERAREIPDLLESLG